MATNPTSGVRPRASGRLWLMKAAPSRLIEQGQQLGSEGVHLLFGLGTGSGRVRCEQGAQSSDLCRKPVILGNEDHDLLLGNAGFCLSLVSLLLAKVCPVAPEARGRVLRSVTHAATRNGSRATPPRPP